MAGESIVVNSEKMFPTEQIARHFYFNNNQRTETFYSMEDQPTMCLSPFGTFKFDSHSGPGNSTFKACNFSIQEVFPIPFVMASHTLGAAGLCLYSSSLQLILILL